jgi:hypothetical protein
MQPNDPAMQQQRSQEYERSVQMPDVAWTHQPRQGRSAPFYQTLANVADYSTAFQGAEYEGV